MAVKASSYSRGVSGSGNKRGEVREISLNHGFSVSYLDKPGPSGSQRQRGAKVSGNTSGGGGVSRPFTANARRLAEGHRKRRWPISSGPSSDGPVGSLRQTTTAHDKYAKRRRRGGTNYHGSNNIVLPTEFMLGGNITDPLNLRSLENEEVNRLANQTPVASPAPTGSGGGSERVEVIIPKNINDPLNLNVPESAHCPNNATEETPISHCSRNRSSNQLSGATGCTSRPRPSGTKRGRKRRYRQNRRRQEDASVQATSSSHVSRLNNMKQHPDGILRDHDPSVPIESANSNTLQKSTSLSFQNDILARPNNLNDTDDLKEDKVQNKSSEADRNPELPNLNTSQSRDCDANKTRTSPSRKAIVNLRFQYGNYNRYYGYRNGLKSDHRLLLMKRSWFEGKVCLDIGCNIGHVTLSIARDHMPKMMVGLDIDEDLIRIAKRNVRYYVQSQNLQNRWFPVSCLKTFGPIGIGVNDSTDNKEAGDLAGIVRDEACVGSFPGNVLFISGNYVLENDDLLHVQQEEFDLIMCLSTTKWIHLNFGDSGLKRTFRRVFRQLRPGGRFLLEPQPLSSYRKLMTPEHRKNFRDMQFKPCDFSNYLLDEVGFEQCKVLQSPSVKGGKGFDRPFYLFRKRKAQEMEAGSSSGETSIVSPNMPSQNSACNANNIRSFGSAGNNSAPRRNQKHQFGSNNRARPPGNNRKGQIFGRRRNYLGRECDTTTL